MLKTGACWLPIDAEQPGERIDFMSKNAGSGLMICQSGFSVPESVQTIFIEDSTDVAPLTNSEQDPDRAAYVLYTSGSTGTPKGVVVSHANAAAMVLGYQQMTPQSLPQAGTTLTPNNFDVSVFEYFSVLCFGGALHILEMEIYADPSRLAAYLEENHITDAYIPPALLEPMIGILETRNYALQRMLVGVEPITRGLLGRYLKLGTRVLNGYGPTETTVFSTVHVFENTGSPDQRTPIGLPTPAERVYLLDKNLGVAPRGARGEITIGGQGVARGYLNAPALTAERFIPDPYSSIPGTRMYRTGDLGRRLMQPESMVGHIEFQGRVDHQIKFRGFRIEPGEIEAALARQDEVSEYAVLLYQTDEESHLTAFVTTEENQLDGAKLRNDLGQWLPRYMVPSRILVIDAMPLLPNGKVNRKALIEHVRRLPVLDAQEYLEPQTHTEKVLAETLGGTLGF